MIEESKHYALAIVCGAKRGPKDSDLTFSPASLRDFLKALGQPEQEPVAHTLNCVCGAVWDVSPDGVEEMVHAPNPPQRKPLTDEEVREGGRKANQDGEDLCAWSFEQGVRFAEAKLKEKNA